MFSILAKAIEIHRRAVDMIPDTMPPAAAEQLAELRQQAYYLGIDLELETRWLPPADATLAEADRDLAKVNRALENLAPRLAAYKSPPAGLVRNFEELRAFRDRLLDVVRDAA